MAEQSSTQGAAKSFADIVNEAPVAAEAAGDVMLTGVVLKSDKAGHFLLATPEGETHELSTDAVKSHTVLQEAGVHRTVQISVAADKVPAALRKLPATDLTTLPAIDYATLASYDHHTLAIFDSHSYADVHTHFGYDSHSILDYKLPQTDVATYLGSDDPNNTLQEGIGGGNTFQEGVGTAAEGIGGFGNPAGGAVNPAIGGSLMPFVLATPHHSAQAAQMAAMMSGQNPAQFTAQARHTFVNADYGTFKEAITDHLTETRRRTHTLAALPRANWTMRPRPSRVAATAVAWGVVSHGLHAPPGAS